MDFERSIDLWETISFHQTYPLPDLVCTSSSRRCYRSNATHAIVSPTVEVRGDKFSLRTWYPVDRVPGDGRWPFCLGRANVSATCGVLQRCVDMCFSDDDANLSNLVYCHNSSLPMRVKLRADASNVDRAESPSRVIEIDSPLVINRATGTAAIGRQGSQWVARRGDQICIAPLQWTGGTCHVLLHGICYEYDPKASIRCIDLMPFPPGAVVALTWSPRLVRSSVQPLEPETTYLFCIESSYYDPERFLSCLKHFYPLARKGMSILSPFNLEGRSTTVLIRVAPIEQSGQRQKLGVAQWGSFVTSFSLGIATWVVITIAAVRLSSLLNIVDECVNYLAKELDVIY